MERLRASFHCSAAGIIHHVRPPRRVCKQRADCAKVTTVAGSMAHRSHAKRASAETR